MYLRNDAFISTEIFVGEHKLDNIRDPVNTGKVGFWLWIKVQIGACLPGVSHSSKSIKSFTTAKLGALLLRGWLRVRWINLLPATLSAVAGTLLV